MLKMTDSLPRAHGPMRVSPTDILAVIPALNEEAHIEECIRSLMAGSPLLRLVPLIVADGGSRDATRDIVQGLTAEFPNLRLIDNPHMFQSAAINLAAETCSLPGTRWLVRCDAHALYPENFIIRVAESLSASGAASVVTAMDAVGEGCFGRANAWIVDTMLGSGGAVHRGGRRSHFVDHGHHAGFDIAWFRRLGGYDPSFSHNEDAEYDLRLAKAGGRIWLDAAIRIRYIPRSSVGRLARQYFSYGKGRARTQQKHRTRLKLRQALPVFVLTACSAGLLAGPFFWPAFILPFGYASLLAGASLAVAVRRRSACGLLAGPAAGTMHMSWACGYIWHILRRAR